MFHNNWFTYFWNLFIYFFSFNLIQFLRNLKTNGEFFVFFNFFKEKCITLKKKNLKDFSKFNSI